MKKNVYSLLVMIALALTATFTACSDDDDDTPPVEIKLDENIVTLLPSESATVKILEGNGSYQVSSQNDAIATASVNESTVTVTGVIESEDDQVTTITVIDAKKKTATIKVYITKSVNPLKVNLEETSFEMIVNETKSVGIISGNAPYTVESANNEVVGVSDIVDGAFTITAKQVNTTPVIVTLKDSKNKKIELTVIKVVPNEATSITIDEAGKNIELIQGKIFELAAHVSWLPASADVPTLVYSSSPESVATVDPASGKITAVSVGTATITVMVEGTTIKETANVTVTEPEVVKFNNTGWGLTYSGFAAWEGHNEDPRAIFNGNPFSGWWEAPESGGSSAGQWIQIDMKSLKSVTELIIARRCEGDWIKGGLKSVKVEYSDENTDNPTTFKFLMNVDYSDVEHFVGDPEGSGSAVEVEVAKPNILSTTTSIRHIKITVTGQWKGDKPCIGYVDIYGYE